MTDDDVFVSIQQICDRLHKFKGKWWTRDDVRMVVSTSINRHGDLCFEVRYTHERASHVRALLREADQTGGWWPEPSTPFFAPPAWPPSLPAPAAEQLAAARIAQPPPWLTPGFNTDSTPSTIPTAPPPSLPAPAAAQPAAAPIAQPPPWRQPPPSLTAPAPAHQPLHSQVELECVICFDDQATHAFIHPTQSQTPMYPVTHSLIAHVLICRKCVDEAVASHPSTLLKCPACNVDCWGVARVLW